MQQGSVSPYSIGINSSVLSAFLLRRWSIFISTFYYITQRLDNLWPKLIKTICSNLNSYWCLCPFNLNKHKISSAQSYFDLEFHFSCFARLYIYITLSKNIFLSTYVLTYWMCKNIWIKPKFLTQCSMINRSQLNERCKVD